METLRFVMITTHYPPNHIGGDAVMVQNLSEELIARGHEVHIAHCPDVFSIVRGKGPERPTNSDRRRDNTPDIHPIRSRSPLTTAIKSYAIGVSDRMERALGSILSEIKPDVVHWHNTKAFVSTPFSYKSATNVYTAHDFFAVCPKSSLLKPAGNVCIKPSLCQFCLIKSRKIPQVWRMGRRRVLRIPSDFRVISPSAFLAKRIGSDGFRVSNVLPNFVPDPGTAPSGDIEERESVVFIGILEQHKGPQVLLDAFSMNASEHDLTLEIIGDGSMREELAERAFRLGVNDRVRIPGRITGSEITTVMRRARLVVVPSIWYENCPLSALEALSFGVPIIASNIGGLPEIATHRAGSATFTPGNVDELSQELVNLLDKRSGLHQRMLMARRSYEEMYSPKKHVDAYLRLFS